MPTLLAFMGIGQTELIIFMVILLILFGHRLPSVMFSLGKGMNDFKKGLNAPDEPEPAEAKKIDDKP